ncbi:hypothetical protein B0H67DRAFT_271206 [Lasiosphaeris hirsuta]|uniref:Uncharacterized protein n=1 Tax=Lasiosphaeris hirsuta TaxID=260670 RepID=A0AA40A801_9PEZI|nr:hypothetical protein B0H67DRAFT_271206 [Lasiosphaeris hirsuta]
MLEHRMSRHGGPRVTRCLWELGICCQSAIEAAMIGLASASEARFCLTSSQRRAAPTIPLVTASADAGQRRVGHCTNGVPGCRGNRATIQIALAPSQSESQPGKFHLCPTVPYPPSAFSMPPCWPARRPRLQLVRACVKGSRRATGSSAEPAIGPAPIDLPVPSHALSLTIIAHDAARDPASLLVCFSACLPPGQRPTCLPTCLRMHSHASPPPTPSRSRIRPRMRVFAESRTPFVPLQLPGWTPTCAHRQRLPSYRQRAALSSASIACRAAPYPVVLLPASCDSVNLATQP